MSMSELHQHIGLCHMSQDLHKEKNAMLALTPAALRIKIAVLRKGVMPFFFVFFYCDAPTTHLHSPLRPRAKAGPALSQVSHLTPCTNACINQRETR